MLSVQDLRQFVFPWHRQIVESAHALGKPAILHSCGKYTDIIEDIICDMKYDGRHSYEDNIVPVEKAYEELHGRIAVLGGIDVHFMATQSPAAIRERAINLLKQTEKHGGYALGTGNSIPDFISDEHYLAMHQTVDISF